MPRKVPAQRRALQAVEGGKAEKSSLPVVPPDGLRPCTKETCINDSFPCDAAKVRESIGIGKPSRCIVTTPQPNEYQEIEKEVEAARRGDVNALDLRQGKIYSALLSIAANEVAALAVEGSQVEIYARDTKTGELILDGEGNPILVSRRLAPRATFVLQLAQNLGVTGADQHLTPKAQKRKLPGDGIRGITQQGKSTEAKLKALGERKNKSQRSARPRKRRSK